MRDHFKFLGTIARCLKEPTVITLILYPTCSEVAGSGCLP